MDYWEYGTPERGIRNCQLAPAMPAFLAFDEIGLLRLIQAPLGLLQIAGPPVHVRRACCMSRVVCSNDLSGS